VRELNRRELIKGGGLLAAAIMAGAGLPAAAPAAAPAGLSARHGAVYERLIRSLQGAPGSGAAHMDAAAATERFARWYAAQDAAIRAHADAVLDELDGLGLRGASRRDGLAALRSAGAAGHGAPTEAEAVRCAAVAAGLALAARSLDAAPDPDEAPVAAVLA